MKTWANTLIDKYRTFIPQVSATAFLVLLAALPYPLPFIRVCWMIWIISWLAELRFLSVRKIRLSRGMVYLSIGITVWFIWNMVSVIWAADKQIAWSYVWRYVCMLAIPFVGMFGVNEYYDWHKCLKVLFLSCLISIGVYMFTHYWVINHAFAMDKHNISPIPVDWFHMDNLLLDIKHRMHYTNILCMLFPCLVLSYRKIGFLPSFAIGIVLLIAIFFTGSRIALVNLITIAMISLCYYLLRGRKRWLKAIVVCSALAIWVAGVITVTALHPRNTGLNEPRLAIWQTAVEQPKDYLAYGLGAGNSTEYLVEHYRQHGWYEHTICRYSAHNQVLGVCMELGLTAAVLFVLFWFGMPFFFKGAQRYWVLCVLGIVFPVMMTDMLLSGLEGIHFLIVMSVLGIIYRTNPSNTVS